jgi:transposase-like protein
VAQLGRPGRRRRLKGKPGRGTLEGERPPILGMIQRNGTVVLHRLAHVQQKTIQSIFKQTIQVGSLIFTDEYDIYARLAAGGTSIRRSIIRWANRRAMKMAMAVMKCLSIRWKAFGPFGVPGGVPIGAFPRNNYRCI